MTAPRKASRPVRLGILCVLLVMLAGLLAHLSTSVHPRFLSLPDSVDSQRAILEHRRFVFDGQAVDYTSWRSRILVPYAIAALSATSGLSFSQSYIALRFVTALLAVGAFALLAARQLGGHVWIAGLAASLLALALIPTFLHIYDIPTDFPDAAFFSLLILLALEKKRGLFILAYAVALLNRESALFAVWVWFAVHGFPLRRRKTLAEIAFCGVLGFVGVGLVVWLRMRFAVEPAQLTPTAAAAQPISMLAVDSREIRDFLRHPYWGNALFYLIGYWLLSISIVAANWGTLPPLMRRLAWVAAGIFVASIPFANLPEMRVYIPALALSLFVLLSILTARVRFSESD